MPEINLNDPTQAPLPAGGAQPTPQQAQGANLDQTIARMLSRIRPMSQLAAPAGMPKSPEPAKMAQGPAHNPSEGAQLFMHNLGATVQQAVAAHKEKQIRTAMADYSAIGTAWENAQMAAGDPSAPDYHDKAMKLFQQMPTVQAILGDPKKMKNIAKAFAQDWLNPEKTTVYGEALKRHMEADKAGKMMKLMQMLHLKAKSQPQLDPQQRQQLVQEESSRLPLSGGSGQMDAATARIMNEAIQLQKSTQGTYTIQKTTVGGKDMLVAVNNKHPEEGGTPIKVLGQDGQEKVAEPWAKGGAGARTGDVFSVNGVPYGVRLNGRTLSVSDFGQLDGKTQGWVTQKLLEANQKWLQGQLGKEKLANIRAETYNRGREYPVFDREAKQFRMATPAELSAHPERYGPASQEQNAMTREGIFQDINYNLDNVDNSFSKMKGEFTPVQRAAIIAAFKSDDPSALTQFMSSTVISSMSPEMKDYVATLKSANENLLSLRVVGGMGQASDMVRRAIQDLLPTKGQNRDFAQRQLKLLHGTVNRLHQAVPMTTMPQPIQENQVYDESNIPKAN